MLLQTSEVKIKKESEKNNVGVFTFSPLPGGFGRTLGNSLRRVLLSSITGAAITEFKIPGINHEFTTVPGVKEDVVELMLNLKQVRLKSYSSNPIYGKISKKGPGSVTAGDIEVSSEVEVINKDFHIAELADKNSKFEMEILIEQGSGYLSLDGRESTKVGTVLLDAIFSPVINVSYTVTPTRKGAEIGLDELKIEVTTDGSVSPTDAVGQASTILRDFFAKFANGPDLEEEVKVNESALKDVPAPKKSDIYLEDLNLPTRTVNALKKHGIETLNQMAKLTDEDLSDIKNLGEKSIKEITKLLDKEGIK